MGSLIQRQKTILLPEGAKVGRDGTVTWLVKGKKKTGKLTKTGRVRFHVDMWTAQFTDETGTVQRVSTKTKNRSAAEKNLPNTKRMLTESNQALLPVRNWTRHRHHVLPLRRHWNNSVLKWLQAAAPRSMLAKQCNGLLASVKKPAWLL